MSVAISLGLDFGTESVRAILVDAKGNQLGLATSEFSSGQIVDSLPGTKTKLPPHYALQDPNDWIDSAVEATRNAINHAQIQADDVVGIGVDFTSCTMLPTTTDGTPLCQLDEFMHSPLAWPKLWKHHGALSQTARMNEIARERQEPFLKTYGGIIGLEWLFPKILETAENCPEVADKAAVWLEAGDWFVWQLVGGSADNLSRSTCQAGYKALWSASTGYPPIEYLQAVHPYLVDVVANRLPGVMRSPGESAGTLTSDMATRMGLPAGVCVSTATIDAHSAVPGVGAADPGTLVMVLGTSSCHMLNATRLADVPGIAGVVEGGILPGLFGYETGQAAVGDAFAWLLRLLNLDNFDELSRAAMQLPPGADGVTCIDWMNGCRTPLMDGSLRGTFAGLGLQHGPHHMYMALMEASAFGLRWIIELLRDGGVPIDRLIATGGLPHHNRTFVEVYADVLAMPIEIHPSMQGPAVGAAVLGMVAAPQDRTGFQNVAAAIHAMANEPGSSSVIIKPRSERSDQYNDLYAKYRKLAKAIQEL
ncbi:UNVERIFIED_CONTAM: hypothetical protein GTU68_066122 [Idotea baltica]|nr:hypothetical protein [Idotea baltica]